MADGSKIVPVTGSPGRSGHELVWALAARAEGRRDRLPIDVRRAPRDRAALTHATAEARRALRDAASAAATAAVRARAVAEVLDQALAMLVDAPVPAAGVPPSTDDSRPDTVALSPREREVLALVADGRSNKAIAEALFLSPNTVKTHVASLLHKLDADSRAQLAAMVARQAFSPTTANPNRR